MRNIPVVLVLTSLVAAASCTMHAPYDSTSTHVSIEPTPRRDEFSSYQPPTYESSAFASKDADNTRINVRDSDGSSLTPLDQGSSDADIRRTAEIRKRVMDGKLSIDAQNVKIITRNGRVTLRGPVKTLAEKEFIDRAAREVAGAQNVDDQIEVAIGR